MSRSVYEDRFFEVIAPESPLNCRDDGGHLILIKKEPVTDRSELTYQEAVDFMRISMAVGRAMYDVLRIERMNYEDLGNWSVDDPGGPKMHLHFFGRAREQTRKKAKDGSPFQPSSRSAVRPYPAATRRGKLERGSSIPSGS